MNNQQFFKQTSQDYQIKALEKKLASLKSEEGYLKICTKYEGIIHTLNITIEKQQKENDNLLKELKNIRRKEKEVQEDIKKEYEQEIRKLLNNIEELSKALEDMKIKNITINEKRQNVIDENKRATEEIEDLKGKITNLTAQVNRDYENSSLPSSKCIGRKKITNNREKTGNKPGAQPAHAHHTRKLSDKPDKIVEIQADDNIKNNQRFVETGKTIIKQVIGISVVPVVIEYRASEYHDKKTGHKIHAAFPAGITDDLTYDESIKAFLFLLNSRCNVSLEKTTQFVSNITRGTLKPSVGMINGLCKEFSLKSKVEQEELFKSLLDAPIMHVDGTVARVNGTNNNVVVCSNGDSTMYFARENKGHAAIKGTPVEAFAGILIHDHEACFFYYGIDHQECLVHVERYLKDSIANEKNLTWNKKMLKLIQEMIHENNIAPSSGITDEKVTHFTERYNDILNTALKEYTDNPPSNYYKDGYNLYRRMVKYEHNHLLFLSNPLVESNNNLCERKARILKGKFNQAISLRSFECLTYYCECLSILDHLATTDINHLYDLTKEIFKREKLVIKKSN